MSNQLWLVKLVIISIFIVGCRKENPTPELSDPIYQDLQKELGAADAAAEDMKKKLSEAMKSYEKSQPRSLERRAAYDDIEKFSRGLTKAEEMREFYKIRLARRLAESRYNYKLAFRENRPWPDPTEFEYYKVNKKLRNSSRNWSQRLQDLKDEASASLGSSGAKK